MSRTTCVTISRGYHCSEKLAPINERYQIVIPVAAPLWLLVFAFNHLYDRRYTLNGLQEYGKIVIACSMGMLVLVLLSFFEPNLSVSRSWLTLPGFDDLVCRRSAICDSPRGATRTSSRILAHARADRRRERTCESDCAQLEPATQSGVQVVGFLDDYLPNDSRVLDDLPCAGSSDGARASRARHARDGGDCCARPRLRGKVLWRLSSGAPHRSIVSTSNSRRVFTKFWRRACG